MAIIKNANDIILQATSPRLEPVPLPGTYFIPGTTLIGGISADTLQANATNAVAIAAAAEAQLASISDDSILSPGEKPAVILTYNTLIAEQSYLVAQANALNINTEKNQYNNAISSLINYLGTIPGWNILPGTDVAINLNNFNDKFVAVYTKKQILLNKLADVASTLATWNNVTGTGKPVDNATQNTGLFANLPGQLTSSNYATYVGTNALSVLGFSQNQSISATTSITSLNVNSDGKPTIVVFTGRLATSSLTTPTGVQYLNAQLRVGGILKYNDQLARLAHLQNGEYQQGTFSQVIYIPSPGAGSISYSLTLIGAASQAGANNASIGWPTIQVLGLKA